MIYLIHLSDITEGILLLQTENSCQSSVVSTFASASETAAANSLRVDCPSRIGFVRSVSRDLIGHRDGLNRSTQSSLPPRARLDVFIRKTSRFAHFQVRSAISRDRVRWLPLRHPQSRRSCASVASFVSYCRLMAGAANEGLSRQVA